MRDMVERRRSSSGEGHVNARLTIAQVSIMKQRLASGATMAAVAREFGVSHGAVRHIRNGRTWRNVEAA